MASSSLPFTPTETFIWTIKDPAILQQIQNSKHGKVISPYFMAHGFRWGLYFVKEDKKRIGQARLYLKLIEFPPKLSQITIFRETSIRELNIHHAVKATYNESCSSHSWERNTLLSSDIMQMQFKQLTIESKITLIKVYDHEGKLGADVKAHFDKQSNMKKQATSKFNNTQNNNNNNQNNFQSNNMNNMNNMSNMICINQRNRVICGNHTSSNFDEQEDPEDEKVALSNFVGNNKDADDVDDVDDVDPSESSSGSVTIDSIVGYQKTFSELVISVEDLRLEIDNVKSILLTTANNISSENKSCDSNTLDMVEVNRNLDKLKMDVALLFGQNDVHISANNGRREVKSWFQKSVKLPQYYQTFINHGFESIEVIKLIKPDQMILMDINKLGHRMSILNEIIKLNN